MQRVTVAQIVPIFLDQTQSSLSPITFAMYRRYLRRLVAMFGERDLVSLTPSEIYQWGKTYHVVQAVQRLLSWAKREARLIDINPLEGMRKMPRGRRIRILSSAESARIMRSARTEFRRLLIAMRESIARPGEIRAANWGDVRISGLQPFTVGDLRSGRAFIFLDRFKARDRRQDGFAVRVIPISRRLGRLMARLWNESRLDTDPVFVNRHGRRWSINAVLCRLRRLRPLAGIRRDHRGENVVAYSMRHTGATAAICAGIDLATLAAVMGHSDVRMTSRYVHLAPDHLARAMGKLSEAKQGGRAKNDRTGSLRTRPDDFKRP